jgi:cell division protein FtsB
MKIFFIILVIVLVFFQYQLWFSGNGYFRAWHLKEELAKEKKVSAELQVRNQALQAEVQDLKQGRDVVEESARQQLGMIKKNETFYRIVPTTHNNPQNPPNPPLSRGANNESGN